MSYLLRTSLFAAALMVAAGCSGGRDEDGPASSDELTGVTSAERAIHFQSYVYVDEHADDGAIRGAIARQVKTAIGALRDPKVSINDRASQNNVADASKWTREVVHVSDGRTLLKVTFPYDDRAVVTNTLSSRSAIDFVMLTGDYGQHEADIKNDCTDDPTTDLDSLWYHYAPENAACRSRITSELSAIDAERRTLPSGQIGPKEANRWFMPVTARLDARKLPGKSYSPEYDRLYDHDPVVYAFFGVDSDETNPDDYLAQEAIKFLRVVLKAQPNFRVVKTDPGAMLLDIYVDGQKIPGVTYETIFQWLVDKTGYPQQVAGNAQKIADLRKQALTKFTERRIDWQLPITVNGQDRMLEMRWFFGYEDGSPEARQHAQWRYLEAFWYGDVFLYNGHSHFGHGPLEPTLYGANNFNGRYQIMLVNSCISFNYYHEDFLRMKPGGSQNLDMVVNGLPSWVQDGGVATARFLTGLVDGTEKPYVDLLNGMRLDLPWERGYDPMRVVDGELDNTYDKTQKPLTITVRAPVYP